MCDNTDCLYGMEALNSHGLNYVLKIQRNKEVDRRKYEKQVMSKIVDEVTEVRRKHIVSVV